MIRREANDQIKKMHDGKKISEDDSKNGQSRVQKLTDDFVAEIDHLLEKKEKDILSV